MSKRKASKSFTQMSKNENNFWDMAISEAEKQIQDAKNKITNLKNSIQTFKEFRENGAPFPGQNLGENEVKS